MSTRGEATTGDIIGEEVAESRGGFELGAKGSVGGGGSGARSPNIGGAGG